MKVLKRNAVIIAVLLFVCLAVYLNWAYNSKNNPGQPEAAVSAQQEPQQDGQEAIPVAEETKPETETEQAQQLPYYTVSAPEESAEQTAVSEYFDSVRLSRSEARDAAVSTLTMVSQSETAQSETADEALQRISDMAAYTVLESEVESIIKAKGFADCVVYITEDGINVTVPAAETGLSSADVARITDVVAENTDFTAAQLRITEVK
ncbi:MAG: SpoIIIAH-like family protein [Oscillospiraceae bacterium]|nr:SpoIIIAH-like family protein [Oscillospiraceae bacterium]